MARGLLAGSGLMPLIAGWLEANGYKQQEDEPCAFINNKGFKVLTYVDDIICG